MCSHSVDLSALETLLTDPGLLFGGRHRCLLELRQMVECPDQATCRGGREARALMQDLRSQGRLHSGSLRLLSVEIPEGPLAFFLGDLAT